MKPIQPDYHSYLLRLWRVGDDDDSWRATLEDVQSGEMHGFTNLAELQRFLEEVAHAGVEAETTLKQDSA